ncbi:DNA recombination protein RmuC [Flavobacterium sp. CS20]|uniref:DNA recombination protein RmuC n=1 Tax=Flavobacterium sp. CS20 TaxID=2775246 RepID=UPI001B39DB3A|nr:DNA recombination protein RmuC [Flavobacterium sp. CS20]QTY27794.1 DNA recombination protein RmuC [Flavobacterium sp. CS20]
MIEGLLIGLIVLTIINIALHFRKKSDDNGQTDKLKDIENALIKFDSAFEKNEKSIKDEFQRNRQESNQTAKENRDELAKNLKEFADTNTQNNKDLNELIRQKFGDFSKQQTDLNKLSVDNIKDIKETIEKQLKEIREDNTKQLTEMRKTVDEKLQTTLEKRLGESFKQVSERLEQVHKGLGEMQNIATGVGDLKRVLSNVKTRGVLGEYQLENILEQLLTADQYSKNVATKKGSQANVEFAIKLPGKDSDEDVWMPVDSKFPIESYQHLLNAYEEGEKDKIESAQKVLLKAVESFAKDISEKYLDPPHTTDFAIMFLPVESLYAEVLRHPGLFEILQRKYRVTVIGPTTLSALLNSLQMGFRTLAVQKRSSEVWKILEAVKTEFKKFSSQLDKVDKQLNTASKSLNDLRLTRTNVMSRKLKDVGTIETIEAKEVLELPDTENDNEEVLEDFDGSDDNEFDFGEEGEKE